MNKQPTIFRYASFPGARPSRPFVVRKLRRRLPCGHWDFIILRLREPYKDWAMVVPAVGIPEGSEVALHNVVRKYAILDSLSGRFFWQRSVVDKLFK